MAAVGGGGMPGRYLPYPGNAPSADPPRLVPRPVPRLVIVDPPWACFGCGWSCRYAPPHGVPAPCVTAVTVDMVVGAALGLLADTCRRSQGDAQQ